MNTHVKKARVMTPVKSSAIDAYNYDPQTNKLTVRFPGGAVWEYDDVNLERATSFEGAESKGRYFAREIKPHHIGRQVYDR